MGLIVWADSLGDIVVGFWQPCAVSDLPACCRLGNRRPDPGSARHVIFHAKLSSLFLEIDPRQHGCRFCGSLLINATSGLRRPATN